MITPIFCRGYEIRPKQEVAARFIPRFYYEGPYTPVAEEEKEGAENCTAAATSTARAEVISRGKCFAAVPAQTLPQQTSGHLGAASHPTATSSSPPSPVKEKKDFLETSTTLLEARQRAHAGSGCGSAASAAADPEDDGLVDEVRARRQTGRAAQQQLQRPFVCFFGANGVQVSRTFPRTTAVRIRLEQTPTPFYAWPPTAGGRLEYSISGIVLG